MLSVSNSPVLTASSCPFSYKKKKVKKNLAFTGNSLGAVAAYGNQGCLEAKPINFIIC